MSAAERFAQDEELADPVREPSFEPDSTPAAFEPPAPPSSFGPATAFAQQQGDAVSMDGLRSTAPAYQIDDLDVPAFLRKRSEVM